mgnify:CR=1
MAKKLNRIKVVLVEKDISQTKLAEAQGKSFSTVMLIALTDNNHRWKY